ncbi:MAG TPA: hypothetical protein VFE57_03230, partial [Cyclobacteriaceae bacterium]|nr:hypothetical protein [Cyclobacteriaceae bacterium]
MRKVKKELIFIVLSIAFCSVAFSQDILKLDSLELELKNQSSDSTRIRVLVALSKEYEYSNYNQAKSFADRALSIAEQKNWD